MKETAIALGLCGLFLLGVALMLAVAWVPDRPTRGEPLPATHPFDLRRETCAYEYDEAGELVKSICYYERGGSQ